MRDMDEGNALTPAGGDRGGRAYTVRCAECGSSSGLRWTGWRAYRSDDPETDEPPALAFYCPTCAEREFGRRATGRRRADQ
jgi:hypothetical protein